MTLLSLSARPTGASAVSAEAADAILGLWWRKFGNLPDSVLVPAFELALNTCTFFPSIAEFNAILRRVAGAEGEVVDGASAWEACERRVFSCWSEAGDSLIRQSGGGYDWPDEQCKRLVRETLNLTVRAIATMHEIEYGKVKARFIEQYEAGRQVSEAQAAAVLAAGDVLRLGRGE